MLLRDEKIVWSRKETIYGIQREYWRFNTAGLKGLSSLQTGFKIYEVVFNNLQEDSLASQTGRGALLAFYLNTPAFIVASY